MFSKKPAAPTQARSASVAKPQSSGSFSVIGSDVTITGDIDASTELHIDGTVEGDISCAALIQGDTGVIKGAVKAHSARLAGRIEGSVDASELVILKSATIEGDARYDTLTIEQGASVAGRFAPRDATGQASEDLPREPRLTVAS
nr:polymer-forming cytoskeletal protein [Erythrobacter sp. LQ02-29]